jgi:hypothetical protein
MEEVCRKVWSYFLETKSTKKTLQKLEYFEEVCKKVPNSKIEANLLVEMYLIVIPRYEAKF